MAVVDRPLGRPPRIRFWGGALARTAGNDPKRVIQMNVAARYQRLIDAALAYREAWRARKAFAEQFREEPHIEQVFLRARARTAR